MATSSDELASIEEAIYDQSFRTLDEQSRLLEGLRSRAGTLAGVATVTTGFVGGLAAMPDGTQKSSLGAIGWTAIALYVLVIVLLLLVSSPSRRWASAHGPNLLLGIYVGSEPSISLSAFRRTIAVYNGRNYEVNDRQLRRLSASFAVASVVFVTELVHWLWMVAT